MTARNVRELHHTKISCRGLSLLLRPGLRQPEALIGQARGDHQSYPTDPDGHDQAFNSHMPTEEKASNVKERDERENRRGGEGKGSLAHFNLTMKKLYELRMRNRMTTIMSGGKILLP